MCPCHRPSHEAVAWPSPRHHTPRWADPLTPAASVAQVPPHSLSPGCLSPSFMLMTIWMFTTYSGRHTDIQTHSPPVHASSLLVSTSSTETFARSPGRAHVQDCEETEGGWSGLTGDNKPHGSRALLSGRNRAIPRQSRLTPFSVVCLLASPAPPASLCSVIFRG